jgi:hypothetical protein
MLELAMPLLEDGAQVDNAVDVRPLRGEAKYRRGSIARQEVGETPQALAARVGEGIDAPRAIRAGRMPEVHRFGRRRTAPPARSEIACRS